MPHEAATFPIDLPVPIFVVRPQTFSLDELRRTLAGNPRRAAVAIERAARAGNIPAQVVWGQMLLDGEVVRRDRVAAFLWFQGAAEKGDAEATNMVGRCYENGWGTTQDLTKAIAAFEKAADVGHVWGQVNLAQSLMRSGRSEHLQRCFNLFRSAAASGNLKAMNSVARFLEEGWVGPRDIRAAALIYREAVNAGDHWAQFNLASLLLQTGDEIGAERWFRRSISQSDDGFRRRVGPHLMTVRQEAIRRIGQDAMAMCAPLTGESTVGTEHGWVSGTARRAKTEAAGPGFFPRRGAKRSLLGSLLRSLRR